VCEGTERNEVAGLVGHVDGLEGFGVLLGLRHDFEDDVILIQTFIDVGDLALAESIVQSVVNGLNGNPEAAGSVAVDDQRTFQAVHLLVGVDVAKFRDLGQPLLEKRSPMSEVAEIVGLQSVLVLSGAVATANAQVLDRLEKERGAGDF